MKPTLLIVNGLPGTGKTTLAHKLSQDLRLPCLSKDDIKEHLFSLIGSGGVTWSQDVGAASIRAMFVLIERFMAHGYSLIAENAFHARLDAPQFSAILKHGDVVFAELYCTTDPDEWQRRYDTRIASGERYPGHVDNIKLSDEVHARYAPLKIGNFIDVDTTSFGDKEYRLLVGNVRKLLELKEES